MSADKQPTAVSDGPMSAEQSYYTRFLPYVHKRYGGLRQLYLLATHVYAIDVRAYISIIGAVLLICAAIAVGAME